MNFNENRSAEDKAWAIASDPSAGEKQWLAACTVLEGKQPPSCRNIGRKLPQSIGLPWSLCVSGVSGLGAFMIFGFLSAAACEAASLVTGSFYTFNAAHAFALLSAAFIAYSSVFSYQQHIWGGGRSWSVMHYGLVACGALLPFFLELFLAAPALSNNLLLFSLWGLAFIGISATSKHLTTKTIKQLECSVGADRVMPYSRAVFATAGTMLLAFTSSPGMFSAVAQMWLWLPFLFIGSGYYIATKNKASNPKTATTLAVMAWNPLILANIVLLPALIVNSVAALFYPMLQISIADYAVGLITMGCLGIGPLLGARLASSVMRRDSELELHRAPAELLSPVPVYRLDNDEPAANPLR